MDPFTAVSLVGNVLQFLELTTNIVSKSYELYNSSKGALAENVDLEATTNRMVSLCDNLRSASRIGDGTDGKYSKLHFNGDVRESVIRKAICTEETQI